MAGRKKTAPETVEAEVVNEVAVTQPQKWSSVLSILRRTVFSE